MAEPDPAVYTWVAWISSTEHGLIDMTVHSSDVSAYHAVKNTLVTEVLTNRSDYSEEAIHAASEDQEKLIDDSKHLVPKLEWLIFKKLLCS
jgi:hypothetical protein